MSQLKKRRTRIPVTTLIFVLLVMIVPMGGCGSNGNDINESLQQMIAQKWTEYEKGIGYQSTGGAALLISSPKGNYFVSTDMDKASPDVHFRIASNTKTFTAAAIMLLYQKGQLNIDSLITARIPGQDMPYVPNTANYNIPYKNSITIRQLLNHTAGVFDVTNDKIPESAPCPYAGKDYPLTQSATHQFSFDELVGVVAQCQVSYSDPSQNKYHYSNTGYNLLGEIIERVSGMSYSSFIMENLIKPNNLVSTSSPFLATDTKIPDPFPVGYSLIEGTLNTVREDNLSANVAEGNIISTPQELSKWIKALITGRAGVDKKYVDMMKDCTIKEGATSCYGLGIQHTAGFGYGHNGAHNGYLSLMTYDPDNDITVVLFFTFLNFDDITGEFTVLQNMAAEARTIIGY